LFTGDIAKVDEAVYIYIVASKKEIIKVGVKRVRLKEIEEFIHSLRMLQIAL
jgi:acyl-CoA synthetase (AMP-forming)/AMP-acid ligase II